MIVVVIILVLVLLGFTIWFVIRLIDTLRNKLAPDIATPPDALQAIYHQLRLKPDSIMYELGCGDARVLCYCATKAPDAQFIGVENGVLQILQAKWKSRKLVNVTIKFGDFRKFDYKKATHFYLYLLPEALELVEPRLPKTSTVVTCQFALPHKQPDSTVPLQPPHKLAKKLFVYH